MLPYYSDVPIDTMLAVAGGKGVGGSGRQRLNSVYQAGRSRLWRKIPLRKSTEIVIVVWLENLRGTGEFGSLLVAAHDAEGSLVLLGAVGLGFSGASRRALQQQLDELVIDEPPLDVPVPRTVTAEASWVAPRLMGDVQYRERTAGGCAIRHGEACASTRIHRILRLPTRLACHKYARDQWR
ncbi:ATP dependent DNA ligase [Nocardia sp. NPDC003979]